MEACARARAGLAQRSALGSKNPVGTSTLFKDLLPACVVTAELSGEGDPGWLLDHEWQFLERAAPQRINEFAAGRRCARQAAAQFGILDFPIGVHDDRRPQWPQFLTGSITHTDGFSAAAVGQRQRVRAIGIDVERLGRVSRDIWNYVFTLAEADWLERLPTAQQAKAATLIFSAKEAFYKCQYELTEQWLEFRDVVVEGVDGNLDAGSFAVRPVVRVKLFERGNGLATGRYAITDELVLTAMAIVTR